MRWRNLVVAVLLLVGLGACKSTTEQDWVSKELVKLKAALAARDETKVLVGCISVTTGLARLPRSLVDEIEPLCYVEAPRLLLGNAVRDARDRAGSHPDLGDINCMQLLASDAFETILAHPSSDPGLHELVDEYTQLCPKQVAKFRARTKP